MTIESNDQLRSHKLIVTSGRSRANNASQKPSNINLPSINIGRSESCVSPKSISNEVV